MTEVTVIMSGSEAVEAIRQLTEDNRESLAARYHLAEALWKAGYELRLGEGWQPRPGKE